MMNAMIISSGLPQNLWGEAILSANYILNKIPHKKYYKTPYELWKGRKPSYKYLKVWGCLAKVAILELKRVKIGPKTVDFIFIGYANNNSAYRFLVHKSKNTEIHVNTIIESRNASFFENVFPYKLTQEPKRTYDTAFDNDQGQVEENLEQKVEKEPRRSKRAWTEKTFDLDFLTYLLEEEP